MTKGFDRIVGLGARIRALRDELRVCESELTRILAGDSEKAPTSPLVLSLVARAYARITEHPGETFTLSRLSADLEANEHAVGSTLARLWKRGKIRRVGRGAYTALPRGNGLVAESPGIHLE